MKTGLTLALVLAAILTLAACTPLEDPRTEGEKLYSRDFQTSYTCDNPQWEKVKRRIEVCERLGWAPFEGCPSQAIRAECSYKGDIHDNSLNNQEAPKASTN